MTKIIFTTPFGVTSKPIPEEVVQKIGLFHQNPALLRTNYQTTTKSTLQIINAFLKYLTDGILPSPIPGGFQDLAKELLVSLENNGPILKDPPPPKITQISPSKPISTPPIPEQVKTGKNETEFQMLLKQIQPMNKPLPHPKLATELQPDDPDILKISVIFRNEPKILWAPRQEYWGAVRARIIVALKDAPKKRIILLWFM